MAFRWRDDGGPFIALFDSSVSPHQLKKRYQIWTSSDKNSGSVHGLRIVSKQMVRTLNTIRTVCSSVIYRVRYLNGSIRPAKL